CRRPGVAMAVIVSSRSTPRWRPTDRCGASSCPKAASKLSVGVGIVNGMERQTVAPAARRHEIRQTVPPAARRHESWISVPAPIGDLGVAADAGEITAVHFGGVRRYPVAANPRLVLRQAREQFEAYFAGELTDFDLPLAVPSGSDFEKAVWKAIAEIGYAEMATYGEIAAQVGDKDAARAVGIACNRNPLP